MSSNIESKPVVLYKSLTSSNRKTLGKVLLSSAAIAVVLGFTLTTGYARANDTSTSPSPSPSPSAASNCVMTDLKGTLAHSDNHESGTPVTGHVENLTDDSNCPQTLWVDIYGSNLGQHEDAGWLESQQFISQIKIVVPKGAKDISIDVPNRDFCWYQVDLVRTGDVRVPPRFPNTDMIDYAFVKDSNSCGNASPTPSPSVSPSASPAQGTVNVTNNNTNNNTTNVTVVTPSSSPQVIAAATTPASELPKTGLPLAGLALGGLTPLGMKLKKFKEAKESLSPTSIWEQRELNK